MNNTVEKIIVDAKSKFGVKDKVSGKWYNPAPNVAKELLAQFLVGGEYSVELGESKGKDGKVYVNVLKIVDSKAPANPPAKKAYSKKSYENSGRDFLGEAKGKTMCSLIAAGLQSPRVQMLEKNEQLFAFLDAVVEYGMKKIFKD